MKKSRALRRREAEGSALNNVVNVIFVKEVEMKKLVSVGLLSLLMLSGVALAYQSGEQEKGSSSVQNMMDEMMKGEKGKEGMGGMMRMMKMMDQCASMMDSMHAKGENTEQGQQK